MDEREYLALDLHAHELLRGVPIHDVWQVSLPPRPGDAAADAPRLADLREMLDFEALARSNAAVRFLFALRGWMGRVFGLDAEPEGATDGEAARDREAASRTSDGAARDASAAEDSPARGVGARVPNALRERSLRPPGSRDGPFFVLYELEDEALSEIRNATVHAFSVMSIDAGAAGPRLVWAVHVAPVGAITRLYMALIDPFRYAIVYPALLSHLHRSWLRGGSHTDRTS